ncbi:hypothetical protein BC628DRAFT_888793 [Trametes gibbosa]|nr:hypothetical protein BC628DRAFT_888793 [Trametes gibbosa]
MRMHGSAAGRLRDARVCSSIFPPQRSHSSARILRARYLHARTCPTKFPPPRPAGQGRATRMRARSGNGSRLRRRIRACARTPVPGAPPHHPTRTVQQRYCGPRSDPEPVRSARPRITHAHAIIYAHTRAHQHIIQTSRYHLIRTPIRIHHPVPDLDNAWPTQPRARASPHAYEAHSQIWRCPPTGQQHKATSTNDDDRPALVRAITSPRSSFWCLWCTPRGSPGTRGGRRENTSSALMQPKRVGRPQGRIRQHSLRVRAPA